MKRTLTSIFILTMVFSLYSEKKVITLEEVTKPDILKVDKDFVYIAQAGTVLIYSRPGFVLKGKFGGKGEGPKEFKFYSILETGINMDILPDQILVGSEKKISRFSKTGKLIKEQRLQEAMAFNWTPLGKGFAAMTYAPEGNTPYFYYNIYDSSGVKRRHLCKRLIPHYKRDNMVLWSKLAYSSLADLHVLGGFILVPSPTEFSIEMYDSKGTLMKTITRNYSKRKVTPADKHKIIEAWQESAYIRRNWQNLKKVISIPSLFPAIKRLLTDSKHLYVQTNKKNETGTEFFIYAASGKELNRLMLPLRYINTIDPYLYTIHNGCLYQLVEDGTDESWKLYIFELLNYENN